MVDKAWFTKQISNLGLTNRGVAERLGIDRSAWSRALNGQRGVTPDEIYKLATLLEESATFIAAKFGVEIPRENQVRLRGVADEDGIVILQPVRYVSIPNAPHAKPYDAVQSLSGDRALYLFDPRGSGRVSQARGKLSYVELEDGRSVIRTPVPSLMAEGLWDLTSGERAKHSSIVEAKVRRAFPIDAMIFPQD